MKKLSILLITLCTFMLCIMYSQEISAFVVKHISKDEKIASSLENNSYAGNTSYDYLKLTNDFSPKSKKDIINIYYTVYLVLIIYIEYKWSKINGLNQKAA